MARSRNSKSTAPWKPTKEQLAAAHGRPVPDLIAPDLRVLFVGINPGLYTAAVGHHFGRPGNRFWPALHQGGFTERQLSPFDEHELLAAGVGITNVVNRATARADELSDEELVAGGRELAAKIGKYRIRTVAFLGLTAYRAAFQHPKAAVGRQPNRIEGAEVWVLPNPSGLNAHYQLVDFARMFADLRQSVTLK